MGIGVVKADTCGLMETSTKGFLTRKLVIRVCRNGLELLLLLRVSEKVAFVLAVLLVSLEMIPFDFLPMIYAFLDVEDTIIHGFMTFAYP